MSLTTASTSNPNEKRNALTGESLQDPCAHILDVTRWGVNGQGLQTAQDGKTVLIPQPSSDPNDPLNWSSLKKHVTLFVVTAVAFIPDFGSSMGVVALLPQSQYV